MDQLQRYKHIVEDWAYFVETCKRPLPLAFWRNALRISKADFELWIQRHGLLVSHVKWNPDLYILKSESGEEKLGSSLLYLAGLMHIQESVSLLPTQVVDLNGESRVLDLCGAPGGKTACAAVKMNNGGFVVCNDVNGYRLKAVRATLDRLGIVNTSISCLNGINYPNTKNSFNRIFVDAPCSCEGTIRKNSQILDRVNSQSIARISKTQELLLERALQMIEPGGQIIYSTCTFAPEENERVVSRALSKSKIPTKLIPVKLPNFNFSRGLSSWENEEFIGGIENCMRVWPHQNDTGGFFVAVIERTS